MTGILKSWQLAADFLGLVSGTYDFTKASTFKKKNCNPAKSHFCTGKKGIGSCVPLTKKCAIPAAGIALNAAQVINSQKTSTESKPPVASKVKPPDATGKPNKAEDGKAIADSDLSPTEKKIYGGRLSSMTYEKAGDDALRDSVMHLIKVKGTDEDVAGASASMDRIQELDRLRAKKSLKDSDIDDAAVSMRQGIRGPDGSPINKAAVVLGEEVYDRLSDDQKNQFANKFGQTIEGNVQKDQFARESKIMLDVAARRKAQNLDQPAKAKPKAVEVKAPSAKDLKVLGDQEIDPEMLALFDAFSEPHRAEVELALDVLGVMVGTHDFAKAATAKKKNCNPAKSHFCIGKKNIGGCVVLSKKCAFPAKGAALQAAMEIDAQKPKPTLQSDPDLDKAFDPTNDPNLDTPLYGSPTSKLSKLQSIKLKSKGWTPEQIAVVEAKNPAMYGIKLQYQHGLMEKEFGVKPKPKNPKSSKPDPSSASNQPPKSKLTTQQTKKLEAMGWTDDKIAKVEAEDPDFYLKQTSWQDKILDAEFGNPNLNPGDVSESWEAFSEFGVTSPPNKKTTLLKTNPTGSHDTIPEFDEVDHFKKYATAEHTGEEIAEAVRRFSGSYSGNIRTFERTGEQSTGIEKKAAAAINSYIAAAPKYKGQVHRGLSFTDPDKVAKFLKDLTADGGFKLNAMSSFSSKPSVAKGFDGGKYGVMLKVKGNQSGTSIKNGSSHLDENEVLVPKGTKYRISGPPKFTRDSIGRVLMEFELDEIK
jgi:hypothetical protein